jgi:hypothetical protein
VDCTPDVAANGRGSNDVCSNRNGNRLALAGNLKRRFPSWLLRVFIVALLAANTINIAADLAGMADAAEMLSGINSRWFVVGFALLISWATDSAPLSPDREGTQMAGARALRLPDNRVCE